VSERNLGWKSPLIFGLVGAFILGLLIGSVPVFGVIDGFLVIFASSMCVASFVLMKWELSHWELTLKRGQK
jgi:hypothetical protein